MSSERYFSPLTHLPGNGNKIYWNLLYLYFTCLSGDTWSVFGLQPDIWLKCLPEVTLDWRPIWTWLTLYIVLLSEDNWSDQMLFYWNIYLIKYQFEDSLVNQYIFYLPEDTWCVFILELDNFMHEKTVW
jgi:hypothetical protein